MKVYNNEEFYNVDGSLNEAFYRQAYYELMRAHNYPIPKMLQGDDFWVCDFLQGSAANLGMGGVFWVNSKGVYGEDGSNGYDGTYKGNAYGFLGHDIYLLPNQTLPEHHHEGGPEGFGPKMEAWLVRHGKARFYGEFAGAGDEKLISELPEEERPFGYGEPWFKSKYYADRGPGGTYELKDPESWHGVMALEEGAVISEFATYHNHVSFSKPEMEFDNTKASK